MIAYKGFTKELRSILGDGKKEYCIFSEGEKKMVTESKTARSGFHCCENPFDCVTYYDLDGKNRFFMVEAAGDIDEDDEGRIACTEITLLKELSYTEFAMEGMKYMINHHDRTGWKSGKHRVKVQKDEAEAGGAGYIAIARGHKPRVKGQAGSILGLIVERDGVIQNAKLIVVSEGYAGKWLMLTDEREVEIVEESEGREHQAGENEKERVVDNNESDR